MTRKGVLIGNKRPVAQPMTKQDQSGNKGSKSSQPEQAQRRLLSQHLQDGGRVEEREAGREEFKPVPIN